MTKTFVETLTQKPSDFRRERVIVLGDTLKTQYNTEISKMVNNINALLIKRESNIHNLYPETTITTKIGEDFDPLMFISEDGELSFKIEDAKIKLTIIVKRFKELFNEECSCIEEANKILTTIEG